MSRKAGARKERGREADRAAQMSCETSSFMKTFIYV